MSRLGAVVATVALALAAAAPALADPPARVTIVAVFEPITYGENAYVNGQLLGDGQAGQLVALEQSAPPFTEWAPVAQTTADAQGYYSFKLHPSQTMQYRTSSQGTPSESAVQVSVEPRIKLKASAAGKTSIRFSGTFAPALDGQSVSIQRRLAGGGWTTIANARLHDGKTFQGRLRAHRPLTLRAFFATDGAHLDGSSNAVKAAPRARAGSARAAASCRAASITRVSTRPTPPIAARGMTLQVAASMPAGRLYSVDVLWGEGDKRDHFTLAPAYRKPKVVFTLRHRYAQPGSHRLRIRVLGKAGECKRTRTAHEQLRVAGAIAR